QELDLLHALSEFVEDRNAALEQGAAVERRRNALRAAVEQRHTQYVFEFCDRLRHNRTRDREMFGRLRHISLFDHGHEHVKVARPEASTDAVGPLHGFLQVPKKLIGWRKIELVGTSELKTIATGRRHRTQ